MRLLQLVDADKVSITDDLTTQIPAYAILSHTWGNAEDEVVFPDIIAQRYGHKEGFKKIQFCGNQAAKGGLRYFWVDSACIDKSNSTQYMEAITSMFRWYKEAAKCYVYLADVSHWNDFDGEIEQWRLSFRRSRWFTRGWTLQELLAPITVEFFSKDCKFIGDKRSLELPIHQATKIPVEALRGSPLSVFDVKERFRWAETRMTTRELDGIYCLQGLFDVYLVPIFGESKENARHRLLSEIEMRAKRKRIDYSEVDEHLSKHLKHETPQPDTVPILNFNNVEKRALLRDLNFGSADDRHANIKSGHANTCKWVTEHQQYKKWLDATERSTHRGVLWIKGKAGCGKSTIMKYLLAQLKESSESNGSPSRIRLLSFFFNARGESLDRSLLGMYRSLLYQLMVVYPDMNKLWDTEDSTYEILSRQLRRNTEKLKELFLRAVRMLGQTELIILVDALDECDDDEIRDMVSFFAKIGSDADDAQTVIRILFSSRHYPLLTIPGSLTLVIEDEAEHGRDIEEFVMEELRAGDDHEIQTLRDEICSRASGVFLWVVLVVKILNKNYDDGHSHSLMRKLDEIPIGLKELFQKTLLRDRDHLEEMKLCLLWVLFASHPLRQQELYYAILCSTESEEIMQRDPDAITADTMDRFILSSSKGLIEVTKSERSTAQFIHESVRDYLLHHDGLTQVLKISKNQVFGFAHDALKRGCETYLKLPRIKVEFGRLALNTNLRRRSRFHHVRITSSFPLLQYSVDNIFAHADSAQAHGVNQDLFLQTFDLAHWIRTRNLLFGPEVTHYPSTVGFLYVAVDNKYEELARALLAAGADANTQGGYFNNPLQAASHNGHKGIARLLLDAGAEVNAQGGHYGNVLHAASHNGHKEIVRMLLDAGAKVNVQGGRHGNTLHSAVYERHTEIVRMLIDAGEDVNAQGGYYGNALQIASHRGHREIVRMLLDAGAKVNVQGGRHDNTLRSAVYEHHTEIVRMLIDAGEDVNAQGGYYGNALQIASHHGHREIVRMLLDAGARVNTQGGHFCNALQAASYSSHQEIVHMLLDAGAEVNAPGERFGDALQTASYGGHEGITRMLLDAGAEVNAHRGHLGNALQAGVASENRSRGDVVQILLNAGADVNAQGGHYGNALQAALQLGREAVVQMLRDAGAIETQQT